MFFGGPITIYMLCVVVIVKVSSPPQFMLFPSRRVVSLKVLVCVFSMFAFRFELGEFKVLNRQFESEKVFESTPLPLFRRAFNILRCREDNQNQNWHGISTMRNRLFESENIIK